MKITINNKEFGVKFGFGALRILCTKWNETTIGGLNKHFAKLNFKDGEEPTFAQYDLIADLTIAGLLNANKKGSFDVDDVLTALVKDIDKLTELMTLFMDSMPKQEPANPESRKN